MNKNEHNLAARIAHIFTFNQSLSLIVLIAVVVLGVLAFLLMPKQYNPEIVRPAFSVTVEYLGASVQEVEKFVTDELVEKIRDIKGVDEIYAQSYDGGRSVVTAIFFVGEDLEESKVKLFTQLDQNLHYSIGTIGKPVIHSIDPNDVPIMTIALTSDKMSQNDLRKEANILLNIIRGVDGVANLNIHGGESEALVVLLDIDSMRERNVSTQDIFNALEKSNVRYVTKGVADKENIVALSVDGQVDLASEARNIVVRLGVRLSDVASVYEGYTEINSFVSFSDKTKQPAVVYISVAKKKGVNAPLISSEVRSVLEKEFINEQYNLFDYRILRDDGVVASNEINGLAMNLITSIVIVGIILVIFLGARPALIVMTAIPLTLLLVFAVGYLFGYTVNRITLFALILSLGLLVDSATVIVENIYTHIQKSGGKSKDVVVKAVHQVGMGLTLSTLTSVVVFLPMMFITGMMGPYMGPIAFFVPVALIMSLVVAFVFIPFLSDTFLVHTKNIDNEGGGFKKLEKVYGAFLTSVLNDKAKQKMLVISSFVILLFVFTFPVFKLVHFQMLPKADKEQYYVYLDMPEGTDVIATKDFTLGVEQALLDDEDTISVQSFIGEAPIVDFNGMFKGSSLRVAPHLSTLRVNITHPDDRKISSSDCPQSKGFPWHFRKGC